MIQTQEPTRKVQHYIRMHKILEELPKHCMDFNSAARATGLYSDAYIRTGQLRHALWANQYWCSQYEALVRQQLDKNKNDVDTLDELMRNLINTGEYKGQTITPAVLVKLVNLLYRRARAFDAGHAVEEPVKHSKAELEAIRREGVRLIQSIGKGA